MTVYVFPLFDFCFKTSYLKLWDFKFRLFFLSRCQCLSQKNFNILVIFFPDVDVWAWTKFHKFPITSTLFENIAENSPQITGNYILQSHSGLSIPKQLNSKTCVWFWKIQMSMFEPEKKLTPFFYSKNFNILGKQLKISKNDWQVYITFSLGLVLYIHVLKTTQLKDWNLNQLNFHWARTAI